MLFRVLLAPLSWIYVALVSVRSWLYAHNFLRIHRLRRRVICIGNLTMGGTGKTPTVIALGRILQETGSRISVILRGYKGRRETTPLLVSDGRQLLATAQEAGDEALMIAKNLPQAVVAVSKHRASCGVMLEQKFPIDFHLLDDGYQHLSLFRDFNLLLIDVTTPFGKGFPPLGRLREPLREIQRADAVLFTRTNPLETYQELTHKVLSYRPDLPIFLARQRIRSIESMSGNEPVIVEGLRERRLFAFAGIGNPNQFFSLLGDSQIGLTEHYAFGDHHRYTLEDISRLKSRCEKAGIEAMITTEKDAEKLGAFDFEPFPVFIAKLQFEINEPVRLLQLIFEKTGGSAESGKGQRHNV
jgi:tetraacyldisaccharide 4'-kinase